MPAVHWKRFKNLREGQFAVLQHSQNSSSNGMVQRLENQRISFVITQSDEPPMKINSPPRVKDFFMKNSSQPKPQRDDQQVKSPSHHIDMHFYWHCSLNETRVNTIPLKTRTPACRSVAFRSSSAHVCLDFLEYNHGSTTSGQCDCDPADPQGDRGCRASRIRTFPRKKLELHSCFCPHWGQKRAGTGILLLQLEQIFNTSSGRNSVPQKLQ